MNELIMHSEHICCKSFETLNLNQCFSYDIYTHSTKRGSSDAVLPTCNGRVYV